MPLGSLRAASSKVDDCAHVPHHTEFLVKVNDSAFIKRAANEFYAGENDLEEERGIYRTGEGMQIVETLG